jgi:D-glycero-D-manno-heptose 1,7-bisphosphate phosphatase
MKQGVILAGGMGSRLMPITRYIPKPLVPICGTPIIEMQIRQLSRLGVKQVIVLTGYRADFVEKYCNKLSKEIDIDIVCSRMSVDSEPFARILNISELLDESFILLYCDNYIPDDNLVKEIFATSEKTAFIVTQRLAGNVKLVGELALYNAEERSPNFKYVELGYTKFEKKTLLNELKNTRSLPKAIEKISNNSGIRGIELTADYISISNFERFIESNKPTKYLLLDRDGVINKKMPHRTYVTEKSQFEFLVENVEALREMALSGFNFLVITNQPAVALGQLTSEKLDEIHQFMVENLYELGIYILSIYVCEHSWDDKCDCRKPKPGMILSALSTFKIEPDETVYIGDEDKDRIAAEAANVRPVIVAVNTHEKEVSRTFKGSLQQIYNFVN